MGLRGFQTQTKHPLDMVVKVESVYGGTHYEQDFEFQHAEKLPDGGLKIVGFIDYDRRVVTVVLSERAKQAIREEVA